MKRKNVVVWTMVFGTMAGGLISCGGDAPMPEQTSYETVTIEKKDITVPIKFSAMLKGQTDVTITPQVSGQLVSRAPAHGSRETQKITRSSRSSHT